jgi:hypothetical protein
MVGLSNGTQLIGSQGADAKALNIIAPLKLAASGTLRGKRVRVTGILQREDGGYSWYEIAIADDANNVNWLWVDRGHFSLCVCEGKGCVGPGVPSGHTYQGHDLQLYNQGTARIRAAVGQFPFLLQPKAKSRVDDYIAPPFAASLEDGVWWVFEYVPVKEIEQAFSISCKRPEGVGISQPNSLTAQKKLFGSVSLAALLLVTFVHFTMAGQRDITPVLSQDVELGESNDTEAREIGSIELTKRWNAVDFRIMSPVDNAWVDLTVALVDASSGKSYWSAHGVEYYHGVDSDGSWSEGSQDSTNTVRSIPAGHYKVLVSRERGTWNSSTAPDRAFLQIREVPAPVSNFLLALGVIFALMASFVWWAYRLEAKRWENSDFAPDMYKSSS